MNKTLINYLILTKFLNLSLSIIVSKCLNLSVFLNLFNLFLIHLFIYYYRSLYEITGVTLFNYLKSNIFKYYTLLTLRLFYIVFLHFYFFRR